MSSTLWRPSKKATRQISLRDPPQGPQIVATESSPYIVIQHMGWLALIACFALFVMFPKRMLGLAGVIVALITALVIYWVISAKIESFQEDKVLLSVDYSTTNCDAQHPLTVTIRNTSSRTLTDVSWDVEAYRPGYSTNLSDSHLGYYKSDRILASGQSYTMCYGLPK